MAIWMLHSLKEKMSKYSESWNRQKNVISIEIVHGDSSSPYSVYINILSTMQIKQSIPAGNLEWPLNNNILYPGDFYRWLHNNAAIPIGIPFNRFWGINLTVNNQITRLFKLIMNIKVHMVLFLFWMDC